MAVEIGGTFPKTEDIYAALYKFIGNQLGYKFKYTIEVLGKEEKDKECKQ